MYTMSRNLAGNEKPDIMLARKFQQSQNQARFQQNQKLRLEEELNALIRESEALDQEQNNRDVCESLFSDWSGYKILKSEETVCQISFPIRSRGRTLEEFTVGFKKHGDRWTVEFDTLPPSIRQLHQRVEEANIHSLDQLSLMIRTLQHECYLFVRRKEQFCDAKALNSESISIHPSSNTLSCLVEVSLKDEEESSDLTKAVVYLSYLSHKYLPEKPLFKIAGGDIPAQMALKKQLTCLEYMPLKDAIMEAFQLGNSDKESEESTEISNLSSPMCSSRGSSQAQAPSKESVKTRTTPKQDVPIVKKSNPPKQDASIVKTTNPSMQNVSEVKTSKLPKQDVSVVKTCNPPQQDLPKEDNLRNPQRQSTFQDTGRIISQHRNNSKRGRGRGRGRLPYHY